MAQSLNPKHLCQIEIHVHELDKALEFYKEVFGWHEAPVDIHGMHLLQVPEDCPWGISLIPIAPTSERRTTRQILYFSVNSEQRETILKQTEAYGGRIIRNQNATPGYGLISQIEDPDGHRWGLVEA